MKEGKFFEMLVECLQSLLVSESIKVTPNEKFYSNGKQIGEVDIVLRGKFGSTDMIVGIECRDRREQPGRSWIREIMGKRDYLAEFGFKHWIAVSSSGFKPTAKELAKKANLELIVPGDVEPVEPDKFGPHNLMKCTLSQTMWKPNTFQAKILDNLEDVSEEEMDKIEQEFQKSPPNLNYPGKEPIPLYDFIKPAAEQYLLNIKDKNNGKDLKKSHILEFDNLESILNGVKINLFKIKIEIITYEETAQPKFRIMAFFIPNTKNILGVIGINEYLFNGETMYLMVAMKPNDIGRPKFILRNSEGKPIGNQKIQLSIPSNFLKFPTKNDYSRRSKN